MKRFNQSKRFGSGMFRAVHMMAEEGEGGGDAGSGSGDAGSGDGASGDAGAGGSAGDGEAGSQAPTNYFQTMPDDWRSQAVKSMGLEEGDDFDKRVKQLERYSDFGAFSKSSFEAKDKIRSGEISTGLPENPTDEQIAAYREANGVPATAEDYQLSLDEGLVLGKGDERIMSGIYEIAHSNNVDTETMSAMTNALLKGRQMEADAQMNQDGLDKQTTDRQLKDTWGGDFTTNLNMVKGLVNTLPETIKEAFESARLADGKAMFNSPEVMVAMSDWARKINPSATVVPNSSNPIATMNEEISALEDKMGSPEWHKDTDSQKRYMDLVTARDNMAAQ